MSDWPQDGLCQESSGFLFRHRCDRFSQSVCGRCGRPVCHDHGHLLSDGVACTSCVKRAPATTARTPRDSNGSSNGSSNAGDVDDAIRGRPINESNTGPVLDDPFFQGPRWYSGFGFYRGGVSRPSTSMPFQEPTQDGERTAERDDSPSTTDYDPDDFTEGDAESFAEEGDDAFEADMGES